jgi:CBS domain-containing protein
MRAGDVMTRPVITVTPESSIDRAIGLMLQHRISGLPVMAGEKLVGIVTEGDFLRRAETGTERKRSRLLEFFAGPTRLAGEYVTAHGRRVAEVMTPEPATITEDMPLDAVVGLMERRRIKRLPVLRGDKLVGIVSRANLLQALASLARTAPPAKAEDAAIRAALLAEVERHAWLPLCLINPVVRDGTVELWGVVTDDNQRRALIVAAENITGVKRVEDHLTWVEPMSGVVIAGEGVEERTA